MNRGLLKHSLLLRLGGTFVAITVLAVVSMSTSWMVAETTQGSGKAINVAGSLRMQSWRLATFYQRALLEQKPEFRQALQQAIIRFENDLRSASIRAVLPNDETAPLRQAYRKVEADWRTRIKVGLEKLPAEPAMLPAGAGVLDQIPDFDDGINDQQRGIPG